MAGQKGRPPSVGMKSIINNQVLENVISRMRITAAEEILINSVDVVVEIALV